MSYLETARESLESLRKRGASGSDPDGSQASPATTAEQVAAMGLDDFARAGLVVRVHSSVLGVDVLFVSDNVSDLELEREGRTVYRVDELRKLAMLRPRPRETRRLHAVKRIFEGTIVGIEARDHSGGLHRRA